MSLFSLQTSGPSVMIDVCHCCGINQLNLDQMTLQ